MQKQVILAIYLALISMLFPRGASANTEPTAYDTRSVSMGETGVSFLERPAAIAINPALVTGIKKFSFLGR
jgi:hypothetical protein